MEIFYHLRKVTQQDLETKHSGGFLGARGQFAMVGERGAELVSDVTNTM